MNASDLKIDRVRLPNVSDDEQDEILAFQEWMESRIAMRGKFLNALLGKGTPFTGKPKAAKKPTKRQRTVANANVRSAYLRAKAAE